METAGPRRALGARCADAPGLLRAELNLGVLVPPRAILPQLWGRLHRPELLPFQCKKHHPVPVAIRHRHPELEHGAEPRIPQQVEQRRLRQPRTRNVVERRPRRALPLLGAVRWIVLANRDPRVGRSLVVPRLLRAKRVVRIDDRRPPRKPVDRVHELEHVRGVEVVEDPEREHEIELLSIGAEFAHVALPELDVLEPDGLGGENGAGDVSLPTLDAEHLRALASELDREKALHAGEVEDRAVVDPSEHVRRDLKQRPQTGLLPDHPLTDRENPVAEIDVVRAPGAELRDQLLLAALERCCRVSAHERQIYSSVGWRSSRRFRVLGQSSSAARPRRGICSPPGSCLGWRGSRIRRDSGQSSLGRSTWPSAAATSGRS